MTTSTATFTNSDGVELPTHSASWLLGNAAASDFVILSNALRTPFNRSICLFDYFDASYANDQYAEATITQVGSANQFMGVAVRCSPGYGYTFYHSAGSWVLKKTLNYGVPTDLAVDLARTLSPGDVLRLEAIGTTVIAKINSSIVASVSDADIGSGAPGVSGEGSAASGTYTLLDNWTGSDSFGSGVPADLMYPAKRKIVIDRYVSRS